MQLSLAFSKPTASVNNRAMGKDSREADPTDAAKKLRNKALRLLTTREHSREELLRKLAQAKARRAQQAEQAEQSGRTEKDEAERIVDELAAQGWQSDERYAEAIVRRLTGQASRRFVADKLAQTGIKKDVASAALAALEQDEMATARALWERRFGDAPQDEKARQKQVRFLLSRGFHLGDAFKIVPPAIAPASEVRATGFGRSRSVAPSARGGDANADEPSGASDASDTPSELVRTSDRWRGQSGQSSDGGSSGTGKAPASSFRRSSFKRSRPWGARNDTDPSDE